MVKTHFKELYELQSHFYGFIEHVTSTAASSGNNGPVSNEYEPPVSVSSRAPGQVNITSWVVWRSQAHPKLAPSEPKGEGR